MSIILILLNCSAITLLLMGARLSASGRNAVSTQAITRAALVFNIITFVLCQVLQHTQLEVGIAIGLFAMFGIVRYRSEPLDINALTLLFTAIGLGILNGLSVSGIGFISLFVFNAMALGAYLLTGRSFFENNLSKMNIPYDNINLLKRSELSTLKEDIKVRLDIDLVSFTIIDADLLRDTALISITYQKK
jgi:hypothetical protein